MNIIYEREDELYHHGIPGMKWYKRRFQNEDGSYTALGKLRYGIGSKGRETARMMSDWSKRMTSKEASNASKMHATPSGAKYFDNPHMVYNTNERKAARSLMDEYARAAWQNDQSAARMGTPSTKYAHDRIRTMARSINGNDAIRMVAARSQYPGDKMRDRSENLSQYMWLYTNKNPEQGEKAREKAFTPVMSKTDNAKLYLEGAKNLAGNYARYAKEGASQLPDRMRKGLATAGLAAGLQTGIAGRTVYDSVNAGARAARNTAIRGADEARKYTGAMGEIMRAYGKNLKDKATNAATTADVYGTVLANGLKYRGQDAVEGAKKYAGSMGELMKAYGSEIKGNANSAAARYLFNANKRPGTGDPGEDRDKLDPNARSRYDTRLTDAIKTAANLRNVQPKKEDVSDYTARLLAANARMTDRQRARHNQKYGGRVPPFGNFRTMTNDEQATIRQRNAETAARVKAEEPETRAQKERFETLQSQRRADLMNQSFRQFMNNQKWVERAYGDDVPESVKDELLEEWRKRRQ